MNGSLSRYEILIQGIVQGVGFRPFVYRLANTLGLMGTVVNSGSQLLIDVEGEKGNLESFVNRLKSEHPPLARIVGITVQVRPYQGYDGFTIGESEPLSPGGSKVYISPDLALCNDCRNELADPSNRRFGYPFINCTNCGPRLTIITGVPYDRAKTTMQAFTFCPDCAREYEDPKDRRYHAEPIACPVCGPRVSLITSDGDDISAPGVEALSISREMLSTGKILAIKGLGGYHLACNALDGAAVRELRRRKSRDEKPFAVMAANIDAVHRYCTLDNDELALLRSSASPIVLLSRRREMSLPEEIAPGNPTLGVMLPYTPLHTLLFGHDSPELLVMTSGNISGEPICFQDDEALVRLRGLADAFLVHDRNIHTRVDDSVVRVINGQETIYRRSRGYVPMPVTVGTGEPVSVLACGGQSKNTFCLNRGNEFYLSHHIGDLENFETLESFEQGIARFREMLSLSPVAVVHDLHPNYLSTQYASAQAILRIGVQHHRAHVASCIADNELEGGVIGVAFDGTGYGDDGNIWGGEFFAGDVRGLERVGHLEYVSIPGGDTIVADPWKAACGYLVHVFGQDFAISDVLPEVPGQRIELVANMLGKGMNVYRTSSVGRLFDAAAAISGIRTTSDYEGQAAMELEYASGRSVQRCQGYPFELQGNDATFVIGTGGIIRGLVKDKLRGRDIPGIAMRFHETVARMILDGCIYAREATGHQRIVLSGGVFQNATLVGRVVSLLESAGFTVFRHRRIPTNDGGLALGQAVIALASLS